MMKRFAIDARFIPAARRVLLASMLLALVGCASSTSQQEAIELARAVEMQREQEQAAVAAAAQERARIAREQQEQQAAVARQDAQRQAQEAAAEAARQAQREEAARIAAAEQAQRAAQAQAQQARIAELEAQIAQLRNNNTRATAVNAKYEEAIVAAESLLKALNAEQEKYANTNAAGEPTSPLNKAGIAELEARKDSLKREAQALSQQ